MSRSCWLLARGSYPHLIVLDEPTNYLDRDSLGALSKALKSFEGGVIIITHSAEFTENLTEEVSFSLTSSSLFTYLMLTHTTRSGQSWTAK